MFAIREAYCPGHFGNSYEAMWPRETAAYLAELKHWGFNRFGDWVDPADVCDPYTLPPTWTADLARFVWSLPMEWLARKKAAFLAATVLGLECDLIITPNHVYIDQLKPELVAARGPHMIGQLLCPSQPGAREIILSNHERQFRDFAEAGVRIASLTAFAYDFGGCGCDRCQPWIGTWLDLVREVHATARRFFPDVEPWLCSWWWSEEERRLVGERGDWVKAIVGHIPYGKNRFDDGVLPEDCRRLGFVHVGYGDVAGNGDLYGLYGPPLAGERLPDTLRAISEQGAVGFQAYSEGVHDDANKAVLAALASGRARTVSEALREYAARYFGGGAEDAAAWARWLLAWSDRGAVDLDAAEAEWARLAARTRPDAGWRLDGWRARLTLERVDRAIAAFAEEWPAERLSLAERFWAEKERLDRGVYALGPLRYVVSGRTVAPAWYQGWLRATGQPPTGASWAASPV